MTKKEMIGEVRDRCNVISPERVTDIAISRWLNLSFKEMQSEMMMLSNSKEFNLVAAQSSYNLKTIISGMGDALMDGCILEVTLDNVNLPMYTVNEMDNDLKSYNYDLPTNWRQDTGTPSRVYRDVDMNTLFMYPIPKNQDAGKTVRVVYLREHPDLVNDNDVSPLPIESHEIAVFYAMHRVKDKLGQPAADYMTLYEKRKAEIKERYFDRIPNKLPDKLWTIRSGYDFTGQAQRGLLTIRNG